MLEGIFNVALTTQVHHRFKLHQMPGHFRNLGIRFTLVRISFRADRFGRHLTVRGGYDLSMKRPSARRIMFFHLFPYWNDRRPLNAALGNFGQHALVVENLLFATRSSVNGINYLTGPERSFHD